MNKRKIKIIITVVIVLLVLLCISPLPKCIEKEYYAVDTFSEEKAVVSVDITYLNFLFLKDKMIGKIKVFDNGEIYTYETDSSLFYSGQWQLNNQEKFVHAFSGFYFNPTVYTNHEGSQIVGAESTHAYISRDFNKILVYHQEDNELKEGQTRQEVALEDAETRQYVGNIEKDKISDSMKYFERFIRETPIEAA